MKLGSLWKKKEYTAPAETQAPAGTSAAAGQAAPAETQAPAGASAAAGQAAPAEISAPAAAPHQETASPRGLTSAEAARLLEEGKGNAMPDRGSRSIRQIVLSNIFTYFNGIFAILAGLLIAAGSFRSLTFVPVVLANMGLGIAQQIYAKKVLDKLALLDVSDFTAVRDGKDVRVPSAELVLGDLIRLESGQQVPADAIVADGCAGVNESLLTGEADEVQKVSGSELKSGSFLTSGRLLARLTHVGADSYAARLTLKAKESRDRPSEMVRDIEWIIRIAGILIIPVGGLLLYQGMKVNGQTFAKAVPSMVSAVIGMIPEGLYLLATVALAMSAARLAFSKVMLHDMHSTETLARVDVLCVDKTGTITSSDMKVTEMLLPAGCDPGREQDARNLLARYVSTAADSNITMKAIRDAVPDMPTLEGSRFTPFDSRRKYSEICMPDGTAFRLGAPEFLLTKEQLEQDRGILNSRAEEGRRVLALTERRAPEGNGSGEKKGAVSGGEGDPGLLWQPVLFIVLDNELRENAADTFRDFAAEGVKVMVISGDNPLTVSRVAQKAEIPDAGRYVDASALDTEEKLKEAVSRYTVFGRVKPEQKKALVDALKAKGLKVAMTGDGVNDILAMKAADCSIAMGSGSDAARQAAQVVLLDSDFSHMHQIVAEGRRDINNITRSATLFLYKNIFSLLLAAFSIMATFTYPLKPSQVSLISTFNIGLPAFLLALEANEQKQEGSFLRKTLLGAMPAALTSFFSIASMVMFAQMFHIPEADVSVASTYLLAVVGFLILLNSAKPWNRWRIAVIVICAFGFIISADRLSGLFEMRDISGRAAALSVVFALAQITVMRWLTQLFSWIESKFERK